MTLQNFQIKHCLSTIALTLLCVSAVRALTSLPKPAGRHEVTANALELVDCTRTINPFNSSDIRPRAIMISVFRPVDKTVSCVVPYLLPATAAIEDTEAQPFGFPAGSFEKLGLHVADSPHSNPHGNRGGSSKESPLLLFSPAQGSSRLLYSFFASSVASFGYTVVTIDHPFDVDVVEYTNGTLVKGIDVSNITTPAEIEASAELALGARASDASFVLNQLTDPSVVAQFIPGAKKGLSVDKVGMFGHSLGGAAAASAMLNDSRIAGGINMDGDFFGSVSTEGLDRPFMIVEHTGNNQSTNPTFAGIWPLLKGWKLEIELTNSLHYTFSDFPTFIKTLGLESGLNATAAQVTDLDPALSIKILTTYVTQFFDFVFSGKKSKFLEAKKSAFYPEVTIENSTIH